MRHASEKRLEARIVRSFDHGSSLMLMGFNLADLVERL